jgi:NADPH:quinone reductase-like Zn-dependent oxidoreductase
MLALSMKAIILRSFGSADNFAAVDLPIPEVHKGEVRIKVKAVSFISTSVHGS